MYDFKHPRSGRTLDRFHGWKIELFMGTGVDPHKEDTSQFEHGILFDGRYEGSFPDPASIDTIPRLEIDSVCFLVEDKVVCPPRIDSISLIFPVDISYYFEAVWIPVAVKEISMYYTAVLWDRETDREIARERFEVPLVRKTRRFIPLLR